MILNVQYSSSKLSPAFVPVCPADGAHWDSRQWVTIFDLVQKEYMEWNHWCTDLVPNDIDELCADSWIPRLNTLGTNTRCMKNVPVCPGFPYNKTQRFHSMFSIFRGMDLQVDYNIL